MFKCLSSFVLISLLALSIQGRTEVRNTLQKIETTRMKSTAGTGVGSILVDEATMLNPASISFFNLSAIYLQKSGSDTELFRPDEHRLNISSDYLGVVVSDTKGRLKGSGSFFRQKETEFVKKRFAGSLAHPIGKKSAFGTTFSHLRTERRYGPKNETKLNQFTFGVTHAINKQFTLGLVAIDPFQKNPEDTMNIIGAQYVFKGFIVLMADMGTDYHSGLSKSMLYRGAMQIKIFKDFYLRAGYFRDRKKSEKGMGAGIGWVGPKLMLEAAIKNSEQAKIIDNKNHQYDLKETSFSLSYRF